MSALDQLRHASTRAEAADAYAAAFALGWNIKIDGKSLAQLVDDALRDSAWPDHYRDAFRKRQLELEREWPWLVRVPLNLLIAAAIGLTAIALLTYLIAVAESSVVANAIGHPTQIR